MGHFRLRLLLGLGLPGDLPGLVALAAPARLRLAVRGAGAGFLAGQPPGSQGTGALVRPARRPGVPAGPHHRDQPRLAAGASAGRGQRRLSPGVWGVRVHLLLVRGRRPQRGGQVARPAFEADGWVMGRGVALGQRHDPRLSQPDQPDPARHAVFQPSLH